MDYFGYEYGHQELKPGQDFGQGEDCSVVQYNQHETLESEA